MFKLDNFGVILFVSFSYKKLLQFSLYGNLKNHAKIDFSANDSKKFVYYNEELVHKLKFQMHLSRWWKRFRWCRKNKTCSIFHDLSEYIIFSCNCNWLVWSFKTPVLNVHIYFFLIDEMKMEKQILWWTQGIRKNLDCYPITSDWWGKKL